MTTQIGRISGPLLKDNLLRDGVDLAFETDLLYLDVNNSKIGIRTDAPTRELLVDNTIHSTNIVVDNLATFLTTFTIDSSSRISTLFNSLEFENPVVSTRLGVGDLEFNNESISNLTTNSDIELRPNGTGTIEIFNGLNVYGNLHATKDITVDGNLIIGSNSDDVVIFNSDITNDIIPDQTDTYKIGKNGKRWNNLYAGLLNGQVITADVVVPGSGILPADRQGNIWYVMANGSNSNVGDHPNGGFATIEKALSVATSGDTVFVYPGTYEETLPLIVPEGVFVKGMDIRNTIVKPDTSSTNQDVFLMNGQSTISDITIKDFYYDSINNTGHAFRFAPGMKVTTRSPYVQNCSVITRGSVTSVSDPLGFDQGDAGRGAYLDGAVADSQTVEASMLFHSVTFITPNVDALTMINGVRVEWLNCFTYFANRGMYALRGTGRLTADGSTLKYGAEVRSIGSANVYGNYGAEADGADTLMYLINHNFAYIGVGKDSTNDKSLAIQINEAIELNTGRIYYTSIDHKGTFRVGNTFYVDLEKGTTSVNLETAGNIVGVNFEYNGQVTFIDPTKIETGNIRIEDNTIRSLFGPVNIVSASGEINFDQNINIQKTLTINNDLSINGTLTFGNETSDIIAIFSKSNDDIKPRYDNTYNLGSIDKNWKNLAVREAHISDIEINTNYIRTTVSNADLELRANGTGSILVEDIRVNQRNISTDSSNISISPATTLDITSTMTTINGNSRVTGDYSIDSNLTLGNANNDNVTFNARVNTDIIPDFTDTRSLGNTTQSWKLFTSQLLIDEIEIKDNYIRTTNSNTNLELRANGTGSIVFENIRINENVVSTNIGNIIITPATTLDIYGNTNINGNSRVTGNFVVDGNNSLGNANTDNVAFNARVNTDIIPDLNDTRSLGNTTQSWKLFTSQLLLDEIEIKDNYIRTTNSNANLELRANGTGSIRLEQVNFNENVINTTGLTNLIINPATTLDIFANTTVNGNARTTGNLSLDSNVVFGISSAQNTNFRALVNTDIIPNFNDTRSLGNTTQSWKLFTSQLLIDEIEIKDNYIRTTNSNANLELRANGTGNIRLEQVNFNENVINTIGTTNLIIDPSTTLDIFANTTVNGKLAITNNFNFDGDITFGGVGKVVQIVGKIDSDIIPDITDLYNIGSLSKRWKTIFNDTSYIGDIEINDNYIRSTQSNSNLEFYGNSAGGVAVSSLLFRSNVIQSFANNQNLQIDLTGSSILDINTDTALRVPRGSNITMTTGDLRFSTTDNVFSGQTTARTTFGGVYSADRSSFARVEPISNTITFSINAVTVMTGTASGIYTTGLNVDDISINNNTVSTNNIDLVLDPDANNTVDVDDIRFDDSQIVNLTNNPITIAHTGSGYLKIGGTLGFKIPAGTEAERPVAPAQGTTRWNSEQNYLEIYIGTEWRLATTSTEGFASLAEINEIGDVWSLILG